MVAAALASRWGLPATVTGPYHGRVDDSFEIAELHVLPGWQGMGIGRELLLRSTEAARSAPPCCPPWTPVARPGGCTGRAGFTDLLTGFRFSGGEPPYAVMGARLPLWSPSATRGRRA